MCAIEVVGADKFRIIEVGGMDIEGLVADTLLNLSNVIVPNGGHLRLSGPVELDIYGNEDGGLVGNKPLWTRDKPIKITTAGYNVTLKPTKPKK